ncbi:MAG: hypothetical protein ACQEWE_16715 [Bacillota bacterium]
MNLIGYWLILLTGRNNARIGWIFLKSRWIILLIGGILTEIGWIIVNYGRIPVQVAHQPRYLELKNR